MKDLVKTKHFQVKTTSLDGLNTVMIRSFEIDATYNVGEGTVEVSHHHHNGLDGKISRVEIVIFKEQS